MSITTLFVFSPVSFSFYLILFWVSQISSHPQYFFLFVRTLSDAHSRRRRQSRRDADRHNSKRRRAADQDHHVRSRAKYSWHTWISPSKHSSITKSRRNNTTTATKTADSWCCCCCGDDDDATRSFEYPPKTEYVNGKIDNFDFSSCPG